MRLIKRLLFVAALALVFVASWIVLPGPNRSLLPFAVAAPELSPWLAVFSVWLFVLSAVVSGRGTLVRATRLIAMGAIVLAAVPLMRLPLVIRGFDARMDTALGADFLSTLPRDSRGRMRPAPVVVRDLFLGMDDGTARVARGVPFAAPGGAPLVMDIYRPETPGTYPAVVQIYGGAWQRGAPGDNPRFATYLAAHGFVVFAIDYRHAPQWPWPAQIDDVNTALRWIRKNGREYDADASSMALLGRSAGAHLALLAAYDPQAPPISAVVSFYGPVDLTEGYLHPPKPDPLNVRSIEEALLGGTPDQMPDRYRDASPIAHVGRGLPPSLLIYGRRDHVVESRFGARLDAALRAAGATSVFLEIPWAEHAFDAIPDGLSGQLSLYYIERFLAWATSRPPA